MSYPLTVTALDDDALLSLRGDAGAAKAFAAALASGWPQRTGQAVRHDGAVVMALSPDEWLLRAPRAREQALFGALRSAAAGHFAAVAVVSDHYRGYRLQGGGVMDVLAQACTMDIAAVAGGSGVRCSFARTAAVVHVVERLAVYDVFVEASYGDYLRRWIDAARRVDGGSQPAALGPRE